MGAIETSIAESDDGWEMGTEVISRAFPELKAAVVKFHASVNLEETDGALPETGLRKALHAELVRVVQSSWRQAQFRNKQDPVSELARQMDLPVALAQGYVDAAMASEAHEGDSADTDLEGFATSESLFTVSNHHTADCGEPPALDADAADAYYSYFANEHGEQAVYTCDHRTGEVTVRMGDAGWQNSYRVVDGRIEGVKVSKAEEAWLHACWLASGELVRRPPPQDDERADGVLSTERSLIVVGDSSCIRLPASGPAGEATSQSAIRSPVLGTRYIWGPHTRESRRVFPHDEPTQQQILHESCRFFVRFLKNSLLLWVCPLPVLHGERVRVGLPMGRSFPSAKLMEKSAPGSEHSLRPAVAIFHAMEDSTQGDGPRAAGSTEGAVNPAGRAGKQGVSR